MSDNEARWREEFEKLGEAEVQQKLEQRYYTAEGKSTFGYLWLKEQAKARHLREILLFRYTKWTFWAALAAVIVGIVGIFVTWFH